MTERRVIDKLPGITPGGGLALIGVILLVLAAIAAVGSAEWLDRIEKWQTGIGALLGLLAILIGALFNAWLTRRRDARLQENEARALADALLGELSAAVASCRGFVAHTKSVASKKHLKLWLDEIIHTTDLSPRVMTLVFEGSVARLGLLGSPLARDIVVIYDVLRNHDRLARKEQNLSRREGMKIRLERSEHLEKYDIVDVTEIIEILDAYAVGGYKAALPVGLRVTEARQKRQADLGKELGIPPHSA